MNINANIVLCIKLLNVRKFPDLNAMVHNSSLKAVVFPNSSI